ncbi:CLUMA_CG009758, isoform A [Clunio marinus]|uniref:CLUMA_CG009758, isoform A n=1 Tax=Clunio marinus TaxID=568069 RepID=A0A1J1I819_9DIPT|nr:CLUMA_CG009758, isoform A [Clunio marinus]
MFRTPPRKREIISCFKDIYISWLQFKRLSCNSFLLSFHFQSLLLSLTYDFDALLFRFEIKLLCNILNFDDHRTYP